MREFYQKRSKVFYTRYYRQLQGATITKFEGMIGDDGYGFPAFQVTLANGQVIHLEVSCDEEANGGGFLFGLNEPDMSDWDKKQALLQKELQKEESNV
jgi:hypothetical protein